MPLRGFCCVCCGLLLVGVDLDIARGALVLYEQQSTRQSDEPVRFDVAEVVPLDSGRWMVHIIKGAFWAKS